MRYAIDQNIKDLRSRSRKYKTHTKRLKEIKENYPYLFDARYLTRMAVDIKTYAKAKMHTDFMKFEIQMLTENIESVDNDFELIRVNLGEDAYIMLRENFIEKMNWDEIARKHNISRRTLSRKQRAWAARYSELIENRRVSDNVSNG